MSKLSSISAPPRRRWRRIAALAAAAGLLVVLAGAAIWALTARRASVPAVIFLWPAAAPVDDDSRISVSGTGWGDDDRVAICLLAGADEYCGEDIALAVASTAEDGTFHAVIPAGPRLQQGFTTILALGVDSGAATTRTFRVLEAPVEGDTAVVLVNGEEQDDLSGPNDGAVNLPLVVAGEGGWQGDYFDNPDLAGEPVLQRLAPSLSMSWGEDAPAPELPADGFSARWTTRAAFDGRPYEFSASSDGGVRLYVDGQIVIDRWFAEPGSVTGSVDLLPGDHVVVVEYFNASGPAFLNVGWTENDQFSDWRGDYYANSELSGPPALIRNDREINFNWGRSGPAPGVLPADAFSARWTRELEMEEGDYRWTITADDGARVLLDGQTILDAWEGFTGQEVAATVPVAAGLHQVTVELHNREGGGAIALDWQLEGDRQEPPAGQTPDPLNDQPTPTPDQPTPTPDETSLPTGTPTETPTVAPGSTATPTDIPGATATATPTASGSQTPTPTATNGTATATPTVTPTATETPEAAVHLVDVNPFIAVPGTEITLTTGNWTPGIRVTVALVEPGEPFSQSVEVPGTATTTPSNPAHGFAIQFVFPTDPRWQLGDDVWIVIHNADWTEWGRGVLELREE